MPNITNNISSITNQQILPTISNNTDHEYKSN